MTTQDIDSRSGADINGSADGDGQGSNSVASRSRAGVKYLFTEANLLIIPTIVFVIGLSLFSEQFLTTNNILNIMRTAAVFVILGVGQTFVIASANIDLSVGSMMALVMALTATLIMGPGVPVLVAILFAMAIGAVFGTLNGLIVTKLKVPALLATLGGLIAYRGAVQQFMYGGQFTGFPDGIVVLGRGMWGPVPVPVAIALMAAIAGSLLLRYTKLGRYAIAIGSNEEAARRAGIKVDRWKVAIFAFQGGTVGLAAVVLMGRMNAAHPNMGEMSELHTIAGVVLGGTLLFGGFGTMFGTVLAMLFISILENGLLLAGAGFFWQQIFLGVLIIIAVATQMLRLRLKGGDIG